MGRRILVRRRTIMNKIPKILTVTFALIQPAMQLLACVDICFAGRAFISGWRPVPSVRSVPCARQPLVVRRLFRSMGVEAVGNRTHGTRCHHGPLVSAQNPRITRDSLVLGSVMEGSKCHSGLEPFHLVSLHQRSILMMAGHNQHQVPHTMQTNSSCHVSSCGSLSSSSSGSSLHDLSFRFKSARKPIILDRLLIVVPRAMETNYVLLFLDKKWGEREALKDFYVVI